MVDHIGSYIVVNELNPFFRHVTRMLLFHFDRPAYAGYVFVVGSYVHWPMYNFNAAHPGKTVVAYNLEPLRPNAEGWQPTNVLCDNLSSAHHVWDQDNASATFLEAKGIHVERIQPMLYTPTLRDVPDTAREDRDIDVLFYGYLNERRFPILRALEPLFYNTHSFVWLYGVDYDRLVGYLARTKIVLNLHVSDQLQQQEQVRIFYALINGLCVVSETSETNHFGKAIVECAPQDLGATLHDLLISGKWETKGAAGEALYRGQQKR